MAEPLNYNLSLSLRKAGFNEPCDMYYGLGHEKNDYKRLQYFKKHSIEGNEIATDDNLFPIKKRNSDLAVPVAPTIQDVVDWLYKEHRLWLSVDINLFNNTFECKLKTKKQGLLYKKGEFENSYNAYEHGITYCIDIISGSDE